MITASYARTTHALYTFILSANYVVASYPLAWMRSKCMTIARYLDRVWNFLNLVYYPVVSKT